MNKNTLTGLLLMGIVIMVFMYINKPSEAEIKKAQQQRQEQLDAEKKTADASEPTLTVVTDRQRANIAATIRNNGTLNAEGNAYTLTADGVRLTLPTDSGATVGGEIVMNGKAVPAAALLYPSTDSLPVDIANAALDKLNAAIDDATRYQGFARFRSGSDTASVQLKNDVLSLTIASKGGMISQAELLDPKYTRYSGGQVCPIAKGDDAYGFIITAGDTKYDTRQFYFDAVQESDTTVLMRLTPGDGVMLGIRYTLRKGADYTVRMDLVQNGMDAIIPATISGMDFAWNQKMLRNEAGRMFESDNSALYYMTAGGDVDNLSERSDETKKVDEPLQWIAFKNQFFSTVLVAQQGFTKADLTTKNLNSDLSYVKDMEMSARHEYKSDLATPASLTFFIGPNSYPLLSGLSDTIVPEKDLKFTKLMPLGWGIFRWINTLIIIPVFDFFGGFIANYGIIILLLTIFIKIILFPFTYKSYMSQAKMRVLAPEIKEINEKYPGKENAMKRQQETMKLYSSAGANPMSGCLPMLLQLPILIAAFRFFPSAIELRGESFLWATDLSAPDAIIPLPFSIPMLGDHLSLFCLLMTAVNIIYTRINLQNQPGGSQMPAMKWMMYLMPVMFLVFFNNYAAGLSYYYLLSLLITIIQTYVFRRIVDEDKVRATMKANAAKPKKKSGFMARLEEAQRKQQAMLREQEKQRGKKGGRR